VFIRYLARTLAAHLAPRFDRLEKQIMANQADVAARIQKAQDNLNAAADARAQKVGADLQTLRDEIAALKGQANPDLSALEAAADSLESSVLGHIGQIDPDAAPPSP
jgi:chromosome segregation ATPase